MGVVCKSLLGKGTEGMRITDHAIIPLKERVVDDFYDPVLRLVARPQARARSPRSKRRRACGIPAEIHFSRRRGRSSRQS